MTAAAPPAPPPGVVPRLLAQLLVASLLLLGLACWAPHPAAADEPGPPLAVTITSQTPSGSPAGTVVIRGQVENVSETPVSEVQVHLWRSTDQLADASSLAEAVDSADDNPLGRRMLSFEAGNIYNVTDVGSLPSQAFTGPKPTLAPGEKASFAVRGSVAGAESLGFEAPGAYLLGVQVRGVPQGQQNQTVGRARSLFVQAGAASKAAAAVVLLNARPSMIGPGVFRDDSLATDLEGRLAALLAVAAQPGSTLLVDPALHDELTAMAAGYSVQGSTDQAARTRGQQLAKDFLARLAPLLSDGRAYRTLYGSPDLAVAIGSGHGPAVTRSATLLAGDHPLARLPLAVVPGGGQLDDAMLDLLAPLHPAMVLVANTASAAPVQQREGVVLVHYEPTAFDGGPGPDPRTTPAQLAARLQAQQYLAGSTMVSLVDTGEQARAEMVPAGWRTRVDVPALLAATSQRPQAQWQEPAPLVDDPTWADALSDAQGDIRAWGELVGEQQVAQQRSGRVVAQALSTTWHRDGAAARTWLLQTRSQIAAVLSSSRVQLRVVDDFVTSASEQEIPVTVANGLEDRIQVKVVFTSENPQRINVADSAVTSIGPGESETIRVKVNTRANGQVGVTARLATARGRPIGQPQELTITATQAGRVGWIIIIASGVVFLAGTAVRIRQVQAERRDQRAGSGATGSTLVVVSTDQPAAGTLDGTRR